MRSDAEARKQIVEIANDLFAMGHLTPTGGNISARAADDDKIWITPSQLYKGSLTLECLLCIREDGSVCEGEGKPSVEYQMHWKSCQVRPDATAAVHTHSPAATAFGITTNTCADSCRRPWGSWSPRRDRSRLQRRRTDGGAHVAHDGTGAGLHVVR